MMDKTKTARTRLLGLLVGILLQPAIADDRNLLNDPSFEQQLPGKDGGWMLFEDSLFSSDQARSGDSSMFNGGFSRTVAYPPHFIGVVSGSYQDFPARPGSRWRLTGYGLAATKLKGTPALGIVQISFFDAAGKDLGTVETAGNTTKAKLSNEVNNQSPVGEWLFLDTGVATAPAGTAAVHAFTIYVDYSGANRAQGVYFDDLRLCTTDNVDDDLSSCGPD